MQNIWLLGSAIHCHRRTKVSGVKLGAEFWMEYYVYNCESFYIAICWVEDVYEVGV